MVNKKLSILIISLSYVCYEFYSVEVPEGIDQPQLFKFSLFISRSLQYSSGLAESFNYGTEPTNLRNWMDYAYKYLRKTNKNVHMIDRRINDVEVRIYSPHTLIDKRKSRILIFYHGGGFFMGSLDFYDEYLSEISARLNSIAISVNYRLAPEYPYPAAIDDCYAVTKYILESNDEFGDTDKVVIAGDSAGGNIVAVMTQRLKKENRKMPKLQVLIYPWLQMFNNKMPASIKYPKSISHQGKIIAWYLGFRSVPKELQQILLQNYHTLLLKDQVQKEKFKSYTSIALIPEKYKINRSYYNEYKYELPQNFDESTILRTNQYLAANLTRLFDIEISPGLAEPDRLKGLSKAFFIQCEVDPIKDHGLIYSERLRNVGVEVVVKFYENCFHASATLLSETNGFQVSRDMLSDLVNFIQMET